ncbi:TetR/AcrR family transcriptional regulator [Nonomuraea pusilla]|uniref:Transcriptional regulator, TetR family n=1 Tax=Nonomuraea pusilla TaxID=46177 RepID=A0A1H7U8X5_9ACTN|nr:TetR/AcrR family transcriptional regulator [Nonomuraea pusilla]SEL93530.1 transcriptional regulator, TetR family [Nonomuraea pusilla]
MLPFRWGRDEKPYLFAYQSMDRMENRMTARRRDVERVDRIVDAAAELLPERGYRRVTVEEVASRAGVSKSSVYLHWNTKDEIFYAVLDREFTVLAQAAVDQVRRDPAEVLAHRTATNLFHIVACRPLLQALLVDDRTTLGPLRPAKSAVFRSSLANLNELLYRYLHALRINGLLCSEVDPRIMRKATCEMLRGMTFSAVANSTGAKPLAETRLAKLSQVVAVTVRRAFEPGGVPELDRINAAAAEVFKAFDELMPAEETMRAERPVAL